MSPEPLRPLGRRPAEHPFDLRDGRLMLSLGPLTARKHCTYGCSFCYVGGDFLAYSSLDVDQIIEWVATIDPRDYDVIYISCDTDSFAPPRQTEAVELLTRLSRFDVDLLFTTREILTPDSLARIGRVAAGLATRGRMVIGCVSLCQLTVPHLEPRPIPSAAARFDELKQFRSVGVRPVVALRPFLPNVPHGDYEAIVEQAWSGGDGAEVVLGGVWYYDRQGVMERAVMGPASISTIPHVTGPMHFDDNAAEWQIFEGDDVRTVVEAACTRYELPMFMRSRPMISWLRNRNAVHSTTG